MKKKIILIQTYIYISKEFAKFWIIQSWDSFGAGLLKKPHVQTTKVSPEGKMVMAANS